jgi:large subunit ribosomal protein L15
MKLNELAPAPGAKKPRRRVGRGIGSGRGKTAGRGQKGQKSRSGYSKGAAWEGGRSRLIARLPKRGFTGKGETFQIVNVGDLNVFDDGTTVTVALLRERGLVRKARKPVKLLGDGELTKQLRVEVDAYSAGAARAVEAAGGSVVGKENA